VGESHRCNTSFLEIALLNNKQHFVGLDSMLPHVIRDTVGVWVSGWVSHMLALVR